MKSTRIAAVLALSAILILAACGPAGATTPIPTVVLDTGAASASSAVTASGTIVPVRQARLSFPLTGIVRTVAVQVGDHVTASQPLAVLDTALLEARTKVADADLRAAQIQYTYLSRTGTDQEHLDSALADVARVQALLDVANATLAQATLVAPFDGTIAAIDVASSETVIPGQVVITMGDLTQFRVETTDLSERDAPLVQVGQSADVTVRALDKTLPGTVTDVARVASTVGGDVVYKVTIALNTQPSGLLWGMSADVRITTGG